MKGMIFDLKHYAIHDGPGIRATVFFKGCPLHCLWCHNPEGISPEKELMLMPNRCARCGDCVRACKYGALAQKEDGEVVVDRSRCTLCGDCEQVCQREAISLVGREMSIEDILAEVEKDRIFFDQSGGGVTLTGGEPLFQPELAEALIDRLRQVGIHVALDTSGFAPEETFLWIAQKSDLVLFDLKVMDDEQHKKFVGVSNRLILKNLRALDKTGKPIWIRFPLIPGVNDGLENLKAMADFLLELKSVKMLNVLPYHKGGMEKVRRLDQGDQFEIFEPPSQAIIDSAINYFTDRGLIAKQGG
ncbi:MAG TPA: glycyl-radical enzyme activating protein [Candidatus Saccharicenans sp.]|jgi:pyruvate formate lyase activating enzyme|nr:glycyl-radical enzyme activating protein [Candidatus Saccharicenans sp.]HRD01806.1 glycyl-radical enzyme activating protein [Candidatus Saccharicenans sp.]